MTAADRSRPTTGSRQASTRGELAPIIRLLGQVPLFRGLREDQRASLAEHMQLQRYAPGERILTEGRADDAVHVVAQGEVEVLKSTGEEELVVRTLGEGTCLGEVKLFGRVLSTATVRAKAQVVCVNLPLAALAPTGPMAALRPRLYQAAGRLLVERMDASTSDAVSAMRAELRESEMRVFSGRFLLMIVALMSVFTMLVALMNSVAPELLPRPEVLSFVLITAAGSFMALTLLMSPYTARDAGLHLDRVAVQMWRGCLYALPWMVLALLAKLALSGPGQIYEGRPLLDPGALFPSGVFDRRVYVLTILGYLVHTPLQELTLRAGLQFPMEQLLDGGRKQAGADPHVNWRALLVSNLCFSAFHTYLGFSFAVIAYLPGVYWGWIYARERSLLTSTTAHWLMGLWTLFVLGAQSAGF